MAAHSTRRRRPKKPLKPYPGFPLTANGNGQWSKKIHRHVYYFGPWSDPEAALKRYLDQRDDLHAGRKPRERRSGMTVHEVVNRFLTVKAELVESGDLAQSSWNDYKATCKRIKAAFGGNRLVTDLASDDFEKLRAKLAKGRGPITLGNEIQRTRTVFKYAYDANLIKVPVKYGPTFKRPSKTVRRKIRNENGAKLFSAIEIRKMIENAQSAQLRAMIYLGINCGLGNTDLATLPMKAIDLEGGWHTYARPKTGVERRCPLWPETVKAVKEALKTRPEPKRSEDTEIVFITKYRQRWVRLRESGAWVDSIALETGKLLRSLDQKKPGVNFYSLRRTFRTIADEAGDQPAVRHIMGHADDDGDMDAVYRQMISDERLKKATDYVRKWLLIKDKKKKKRATTKRTKKTGAVPKSGQRKFRVVG